MTMDAIEALEAALAHTADDLTAPGPDECLLHYLQRMLTELEAQDARR